MQKQQFSTEIKTSKEKVWSILWDDKTFRDWANNIDEGMYLVGKMEEGAEVQFFSRGADFGVTSVIEKLTPNEFVLFRHRADTIEGGTQEREKEWTGGEESYALTEKNGTTILIITTDIPPSQEETMRIRIPQALERVKALAEGKE